MIKVQCPYCNEYMKAEDWKNGMFNNCICCDKRFEWWDVSDCYSGSHFAFHQFIWLLENDFKYIDKMISKQFSIVIRKRWIDNNLLEYYALGTPDLEFDIVDIFKKIIERKYIYKTLNDRHVTLSR
ncbi:MAG: hypothetical protein K9K86_08215 [Pseudomonadales bacterium]|nr:hypothetical protein [Pseudomonadales bacterium]